MNKVNDYALDLFIGQGCVARLEFHPEQDSFSLTYSPEWASDRRAIVTVTVRSSGRHLGTRKQPIYLFWRH